jgi:hypothetical protein
MAAPSGVGRSREVGAAAHAAPANAGKARPRAFVLGRDRKSAIPPVVIDQAISAFRSFGNIALSGMAAAGLVRALPDPRRSWGDASCDWTDPAVAPALITAPVGAPAARR